MCPGPTFDRIYFALKGQLASGIHAPGEHLEPAVIGEALFASITPVRDALHRLAGERIVEAPRHDGFRVPSPTEAELRDLYRWNCRLLELALVRPASPAHDEPAPDAASLFRLVARLSGSREHERTIDNASDRLGSMRAVEPDVLPGTDSELDRLLDSYRRRDWRTLRSSVRTYHRRRERAVPELLAFASSKSRGE
jgi:DNA-binding GntR family transcriptional regulator